MKISRQRYQVGSLRKNLLSHGFSWEFRYYFTDETGKRKAKSESLDGVLYPTERDARKLIESKIASLNADSLAVRSSVTLGTLIDRYIEEELPCLKPSTQETNLGRIEKHIRPRWGENR